jgi:cytochrome c oxidase assembly protein subunit 11
VTALAQRNARTALLMALVAAAMVGLAFASVPLYRLFCEVTGFAGTTQRADRAPGAIAGQVGVRFDANVHPGLPWRFEPVQRTVQIAPGARTQIFYRATNLVARTTTGQAVFNVTPDKAGRYFKKIECFCFTEQALRPGQTADMPVVFFVDPAIRNDPDTRDIDEITLSYTFYPVETPASRG